MISVLIIAKNEDSMIADAIRSVKLFATEIIVVDGGSSDKTIEISKKEGAVVIKNDFHDFSDQRNLALASAHEEWVFYLDADERVTPSFVKELNEKIASSDESIAGFNIKRKTFYYGKDWKFTDKMARVFKKSKLKSWHGIVHESPVFTGKLVTISEPVLHYTHRNFEQMIKKTNEWSEYEADLRIKARHPKMTPIRFIRVMISAFIDSYFKGGGYKNGTAGFIEATYQSFSMFITYAKLWEKQLSSK